MKASQPSNPASVRIDLGDTGDPPSSPETPARTGRGQALVRLYVATLAAALVTGAWVLVAQVVRPAASPQAAELGPPPTLDPAPTETTTTTATSTTTTSPFREPDREIEVSVTDDNTIIRQEPWTRRVIWESAPFRGPVEIVSVDPNTVTLDYSGTRLLVSLTDGTLLPP